MKICIKEWKNPFTLSEEGKDNFFSYVGSVFLKGPFIVTKNLLKVYMFT